MKIIKNIVFLRKGVSPLITIILLVVVAVILITILLSFGKDFAIRSLEKTNSIDNSSFSEVEYYIYVNESKNGRLFLNYSAPQSLTEKVVYILGYNLQNYPRIDFEEPVVLKEGINSLDLGIMKSNFDVVLYLDNNYQILLKDVYNRNRGPRQNDCPEGYVPIPGNVIYNTNYSNTGGFCVMKYEAKMDENNDGIGDSNVSCKNTTYDSWENSKTNCSYLEFDRAIISSAQGIPIGAINQMDCKSACNGLGPNYHLITNDEWMTIVRNVEMQSQNWISREIGVGYMNSGNLYSNKIHVASLDLIGSGRYRRTLFISNGSEVWDLTGNMWDTIDANITCNNSPVGETAGSKWLEFASGSGSAFESITSNGSFSNKDLYLINYNYNSNQGVGMFFTGSSSSTTINSILRGGDCTNSLYYGGVLSVLAIFPPSLEDPTIGFRCVYVP